MFDSQTETAAVEIVDTDLESDEQTETEEEMETEEVYIVCKNSCLISQLCGVTAEGLLIFEHYYCLECGGGVEIKSAFPSKFRGVVIAVIPADDVVNAIMPSVD